MIAELFRVLMDAATTFGVAAPIQARKRRSCVQSNCTDPAQRRSRNPRLKGRGYEVVSSRLPAEKSQIVCLRHRGEWTALALYSHLKKLNIVTAPRGDRLRIAPHLYNTTEDIEALLSALP